jgi:hypothetical protein
MSNNTSEGIILNTDKIAPTLNDMLSSENDTKVLDNIQILPEQNSDNKIMDLSLKESEREILPNNNKKIKETEKLKENKSSSSVVIQVPQSFRSDDFNKDKNNQGTLDESVYATVSRDFSMIYNKLKYVINPFISREMKYNHIRQWDLWGPLLLNLILASTLALNTKEKGQITSLIFIIFWLGGVAIYLNNYFLEVKASIFQIFCLLGYCLFPLNIAAIIVTIINSYDIIRLIVVGFTCFWSIYSSSDYLKAITTQDKRYLVLYPCILFYLYISWFIFATKR